MLSAYDLLLSLSAGIDGIIVLACGECPYGARLKEVEGVISGAREILRAFGLGSERIGMVVVGEDGAIALQESLVSLFEVCWGT